MVLAVERQSVAWVGSMKMNTLAAGQRRSAMVVEFPPKQTKTDDNAQANTLQ